MYRANELGLSQDSQGSDCNAVSGRALGIAVSIGLILTIKNFTVDEQKPSFRLCRRGQLQCGRFVARMC